MVNNLHLTEYVVAIVQQLIDSGVSEVVISPGSRSTPLALVMAEHPNIKTYINIDERSAGFFALGLAKKQKKPVALLCTSGTASANYFPAIIEAYYARVPLIILTADRPHELRDVGAPQAIDQIQIYGKYVKWSVDALIPDNEPFVLDYVKNIVTRGVFEATKSPFGPIHINLPFREPLVPDLSVVHQLKTDPKVSINSSKTVLDEGIIHQIAKQVQKVKKGLIICGEIYDQHFINNVVALAKKLKFPILADPLSQLRFGEHNKEMIIDTYDTILKDDSLHTLLKPEYIIRFGAMPVSKSLFLFLKKYPDVKQIVIDSGTGFRDPTLYADHIYCDENSFCQMLSEKLEVNMDEEWYKLWSKANNVAQTHLFDMREIKDDLFEGKLYIELQKILPNECNLMVGNSMPIRDVDTFFRCSEKKVHFYSNRGANGIDGVVSTALGISAASDLPTYLVIGDLSFYHDLNGLLTGKLHELNLTIFLINNNGGGIFSFLPQAKEKKHFEDLFGTPTNICFEHAAKMFNIQYSKIKTWDELRLKMNEVKYQKGINLIEIPTNRHSRVDIHRNIIQSVSQEIRKELGI